MRSCSESPRHLYTIKMRPLNGHSAGHFDDLRSRALALAEPADKFGQLSFDEAAELLRDNLPKLPAISDLIEVLHNNAHSDPAFVPKVCISVSM